MLSGEYSNLTKMLGGKVIKIEQGKPAGINPFELEADYKGKEKFLNCSVTIDVKQNKKLNK